MQTAVLNKKIDLVAAAQSFVMNLTSNNAFAFNSGWMENTGKIMKKKNGLGQRLQEIESFFFDPDTPRSVIDYYNERTNRTLMQLFVCAQSPPIWAKISETLNMITCGAALVGGKGDICYLQRWADNVLNKLKNDRPGKIIK